jgi:hypothetical protein
MKQITQGYYITNQGKEYIYVTPYGRVKCVDMLHAIQLLTV